jgi:hypothetical protein
VLDVDLKSESQSLCVDIYNKYCTYRYICRSINITILQNLLYLNCLYVNMDDSCSGCSHITLNMPLYSVGGGGMLCLTLFENAN